MIDRSIKYIENEKNENLVLELLEENEIIELLDFFLAVYLGQNNIWNIMSNSFDMLFELNRRFNFKRSIKAIYPETKEETLH